MATIVNNPSGTSDSNNAGLLYGILLIIAMVLLFYFFGLPLLQGGFNTGSQVNVPGKVDVNLQTPQK